MEIERKFLVDKDKLPLHLEDYPHSQLEQAYLLTEPVLRIRRQDQTYILTCKGPGLMKREESEYILSEEAYQKLRNKTEGNPIAKTRYRIPDGSLTIELDIFEDLYAGLYLAEVEFKDEATALDYTPPTWFGREVTYEHTFHNSNLSQLSHEQRQQLLSSL